MLYLLIIIVWVPYLQVVYINNASKARVSPSIKFISLSVWGNTNLVGGWEVVMRPHCLGVYTPQNSPFIDELDENR
jgi:hypothetical protein